MRSWPEMFSAHHTDFSLLAGARRADQSFQLISDAFVIIQDLSQLLHNVLSLARVWQVPCSNTQLKADVHSSAEKVIRLFGFCSSCCFFAI